MSRIRLGSATPIVALLTAGCATNMSVFRPAGPFAAKITHLTWFLIILATIVYIGVMGVLMWAISRNRSRDPAAVDLSHRPHSFVIWGGAIIPAIVLLAVFVAAMRVTGLFPPAAPRDALSVQVTGNQWWWKIEYRDPDLSKWFVTANELHIPVGRPVRVTLVSSDVIHSFWVPRLQGKLDLIPGDTNEIRLIADSAGDYRGQCAEYCGAQHAHMGFHVIAEDPATFNAWVASQRTPAAPPTDSLTHLGEDLFVSGPCSSCHTIRGTPAVGQVAPDLTHIASRSTIAAGALPNTLGNMEAWITNAQSIKPGARMPSITQFSGTQLRALATYLESLH
jgi:cytochrome c oxidase subunit II